MPWLLPCLLTLAGCAPPIAAPSTFDERGGFYLQPLAVQQSQAYPQTVTGRFISLIDFEPASDGADERLTGNQIRHFEVVPPTAGRLRTVMTTTRTGIGAMRVTLDPAAALVFRSPFVRDLRPYTLLSVAVHADAVRDDLQLTLTGPKGSWQSRRRLLRAGWNTVLVDLNSVARSGKLDLAHFDALSLSFTDADEPVVVHVDDIMLIDNRRTLARAPSGITVTVNGLDYTLRLPGWAAPIGLHAGRDGLWRMGGVQPVLQLTGPTHPRSAAGEDLAIMGDRRVGTVEVIEVNALRVRIRNTWYFPPAAGFWIDMDVRQVRWDYTFYGDGRWVTDVLINNAGGDDISRIVLTTPTPVAFADGRIGRTWERRDLEDPAARCAMMTAPPSQRGQAQLRNYAAPAAMRISLGRSADAAGDRDGDGFDETEGCYTARASGGNCRVQLTPNAALHQPVIRVRGPWTKAVTANCDGLALRPIVRLADGVLVAVPAALTRPAVVEFAGEVSVLDE